MTHRNDGNKLSLDAYNAPHVHHTYKQQKMHALSTCLLEHFANGGLGQVLAWLHEAIVKMS